MLRDTKLVYDEQFLYNTDTLRDGWLVTSSSAMAETLRELGNFKRVGQFEAKF